MVVRKEDVVVRERDQGKNPGLHRSKQCSEEQRKV